MVIAYHLIWTGYGWWLPNDVRGSTSHYIASDVLAELGAIHYGRKKIQPRRQELLRYFDRAHPRLNYAPLTFDARAFELIAKGFQRAIRQNNYTCYACAVMPDHVHLVIRKHKHLSERMISHLQRESHIELRDKGWIDMEHPVWGGHGWTVYLDHPDDIRRTIKYVRNNPLPRRLPVQEWDFVTPYDNWPLHAGYNRNSPFARAIREAEKER